MPPTQPSRTDAGCCAARPFICPHLHHQLWASACSQVLGDTTCGDVWKLQFLDLLLQDCLLSPQQAVALLNMFDRCGACVQRIAAAYWPRLWHCCAAGCAAPDTCIVGTCRELGQDEQLQAAGLIWTHLVQPMQLWEEVLPAVLRPSQQQQLKRM